MDYKYFKFKMCNLNSKKLTADEMRGMLDTDANLNATMMGREGLIPASCPGKIDTRNVVDMELEQMTTQDTTEERRWEDEPLFRDKQGDENLAKMESEGEFTYWMDQDVYEADKASEYGLEELDPTTKECWGCCKVGHIKSQCPSRRDKRMATTSGGNYQNRFQGNRGNPQRFTGNN